MYEICCIFTFSKVHISTCLIDDFMEPRFVYWVVSGANCGISVIKSWNWVVDVKTCPPVTLFESHDVLQLHNNYKQQIGYGAQ